MFCNMYLILLKDSDQPICMNFKFHASSAPTHKYFNDSHGLSQISKTLNIGTMCYHLSFTLKYFVLALLDFSKHQFNKHHECTNHHECTVTISTCSYNVPYCIMSPVSYILHVSFGFLSVRSALLLICRAISTDERASAIFNHCSMSLLCPQVHVNVHTTLSYTISCDAGTISRARIIESQLGG